MDDRTDVLRECLLDGEIEQVPSAAIAAEARGDWVFRLARDRENPKKTQNRLPF